MFDRYGTPVKQLNTKSHYPIRIEFFGDEIDRLCEFDVVTGAILKEKNCIAVKLLESLGINTNKLLSALTFLMMFYYFVYIVYYSVVTYELSKVIMGSISLCMMIHLNKSLH